uniref:Uncharacterized protein n=1 Tax=Brassica oleracea TaxID=3712 RepID=A0A3P6G5W7_BRAOL|nr:unnamed protein product [Brassica oleracea]
MVPLVFHHTFGATCSQHRIRWMFLWCRSVTSGYLKGLTPSFNLTTLASQTCLTTKPYSRLFFGNTLRFLWTMFSR